MNLSPHLIALLSVVASSCAISGQPSPPPPVVAAAAAGPTAEARARRESGPLSVVETFQVKAANGYPVATASRRRDGHLFLEYRNHFDEDQFDLYELADGALLSVAHEDGQTTRSRWG